MKKILVAIALAALATTASATILGSRHDFTSTGTGSIGTRYTTGTVPGTCQFCHAPHLWKATNLTGTGGIPLWNRNSTLTPFTMYSTLLGHLPAAPNTRSLTCLGCHDGRLSVGALNNWNGAPLANQPLPAGGNYTNGSVLTNDHPISVAYPPVNAPAGEYVGSPMFGTFNPVLSGNIECASCHDPHTTAISFFLRGAVSTLCSVCHSK